MELTPEEIRATLRVFARPGTELNVVLTPSSAGWGRDGEGAHSGGITVWRRDRELATLHSDNLDALLQALEASDDVVAQARQKGGRKLSLYVTWDGEKLSVSEVR